MLMMIALAAASTFVFSEDQAACKANADMFWCQDRPKASAQYTDEAKELRRVDTGVRSKFTYIAPRGPDTWASHNVAMERGEMFTGDCDDLP